MEDDASKHKAASDLPGALLRMALSAHIGEGQFDYITMGGLFTILKVREKLANYDDDPGWYQNPPGTVASLASADELRRDGITVTESVPGGPRGTKYTCPMHPEVVLAKPGACPKCKMKLVPEKSTLPSARSGSGHKH